VWIELDGVESLTIGREGVVFERTSPTHTLWLSLDRRGEFTLHRTTVTPTTDEGPHIAPAIREDANQAISGLAAETAVSGHTDAPEEVAATCPTTTPGGAKEHQERVSVFGRLATEVRFKTRPNGRFIAEFVLAEWLDEDQTRANLVIEGLT